jgi:N-acetylglucosaminyldiphosphoundecaprenol N-acetyl-beta-D-mannosaminyltransferase
MNDTAKKQNGTEQNRTEQKERLKSMIVRYNFLGVFLDYLSGESAVNCVEYFIQQRRAAKVYFLNAHCYNMSVSDQNYRQALHAADLLLPDGVGVLWGCKVLGLPHRENLNGSDFIPHMCDELIKRRGSLSIYILGGRPGIAEQARHNLEKKHGSDRLKVVGTQHGYFKPEESEAVVAEINRLNPDVVLVGMGVPLQELWINCNAANLRTGVVFGVGALLDFLAERIERAPRGVQQAGLEWAWRLIREPKRLFVRYIVGNPLFVSRVLAGHWAGVQLNLPLLMEARPVGVFTTATTKLQIEVEQPTLVEVGSGQS